MRACAYFGLASRNVNWYKTVTVHIKKWRRADAFHLVHAGHRHQTYCTWRIWRWGGAVGGWSAFQKAEAICQLMTLIIRINGELVKNAQRSVGQYIAANTITMNTIIQSDQLIKYCARKQMVVSSFMTLGVFLNSRNWHVFGDIKTASHKFLKLTGQCLCKGLITWSAS